MTMPTVDTSWGGLLTAGLNLAAGIYQGQVAKKVAKTQAKAAATDFPQLGVGLAASGPQRGMINFSLGEGGMQVAMPGVTSGGSSTAIMPRGPQYGVVMTPSGGQRVVGVRSMGTPLLWSGDFAAVKRVARVARKLGRFVRHRRPR